MSPMNQLLLVDDHTELAENLAEILEDAGFTCRIEPSAEDALAALSSGEFCGLVTDYRLPGLSGLELISELRARGHGLPVILISAYAADDVIDQAKQAGALDVLTKPVNMQQLTELLDAFRKSDDEVLVVEDDSRLLDNLAELLSEHGYRVATKADALSTFAYKRLPKAALLDIRLPDGNGIDLARQLIARDPSIQILVMSGFFDEQIEEALASFPHPVATLLKPITPAALIEHLSQLNHK